MLREYRKRKNISQEKLEEITNLDRKTIFRIENDVNMPLVDTFGKIAIALEMTNEEIGKEIRKITLNKREGKKWNQGRLFQWFLYYY